MPGFTFEADRTFPEGADTIYGSKGYDVILPSGRDATKHEDFASQPSGETVGARPSDVVGDDHVAAAQRGGGPSQVTGGPVHD